MPENHALEAEEITTFFDTRAGDYDDHMLQNVEHFDEFYAAIAEPIPVTDARLQILDLGCGTGLELEPILQRVPNAQVTGIDLSANMLAQLENKYASQKAQIELIRGSYLELSLGSARFDYVISVMTLHHLLPQKKTRSYKKIHRALKSGGKYIEADYVVSKDKEIRLLAEYQEKTDAGYLDGSYHLDIPMSLETLKALLTTAGFTNIEVVWQFGEALVLEASGRYGK